MKTFLCSLLVALSTAATLQADIQAPPISDQGPTRKLGRGLANVAFAVTDWANTIGEVNDKDGNEAAYSYGIVRGAGRFFTRTGVGLFEVFTFPFPLNKGKYTPILRDDVPWIYSGYEEFPPELGFESRYNYAR